MRKILGPSNMHWLYIYVSGGYFTLRILVFEQVNTHRLLFEGSGRCACGIEVHIDITPTWTFTGRLLRGKLHQAGRGRAGCLIYWKGLGLELCSLRRYMPA